MRIYVDGKEAVLKAGSSFEYVSENPLFTEAEGYSLEIEFPLKDCPENILIFGALHVQGVDIKKVSYECRIESGPFMKSGALAIVEVNEIEVKGQFLEGLSVQRFNAGLVDLYLNEIDYDEPSGLGYAEGWSELVVYDKGKEEFCRPEGTGYSYYYRHVNLYHLIELIAYNLGLDLDVADLEAIPMYRKIVVANMTTSLDRRYRTDNPSAYQYFVNLKKAMPHWTVKKFFNQVGAFFGCICFIDTFNGKVIFRKRVSYVNNSSLISIAPLDEYSIELGSGEEVSYGARKKYKLSDECNPGNVNMCSWFIKELANGRIGVDTNYTFASYASSIEYYATHSGGGGVAGNRVKKIGDLYIAVTEVELREDINPDDDTKHEAFAKYEVINQFGDLNDGEELGIVPCPLDYKRQETAITHVGGTYGPRAFWYPYKVPVIDIQGIKYMNAILNPHEIRGILADGEDGLEYNYSKLYIVLVNSEWDDYGYHVNVKKYEPEAGMNYAAETIAATEKDVPTYHGLMREYDYMLAPNDPSIAQNMENLNIDETQLYRYKFLGTTIPSPTSIFLINGQRFACLRITAHFTPTGMSELLEGEFYRIID